jgi:hypothetical protein
MTINAVVLRVVAVVFLVVSEFALPERGMEIAFFRTARPGVPYEWQIFPKLLTSYE